MNQASNQDYALITGASSGIGAAIAREYASRGKPLILTARRIDRLHALATELSALVPCQVIAADLADPSAPMRLFEETQSRGWAVDTLVNNAGYGVPGRYLSQSWKTHAEFLQVMIVAVGQLTHLYLPAMEAAGRGRILNVASMAGLVPASAGHTMYGATKAWLIRFSESLAQESAKRGIHVTALCAGFTYTEFHDVNGMRSQVSRLPKILWMDAAQVARVGVDAVESGKARAIPGAANKMVAFITRYLPDALARALVASKSRDFRNAD